MTIVHIVERLNSFLDTTFEIDAARTGLVETKGHFLRAMAGERAMPCARRLCRFTVFVMSVSMLISFVAGSAADNAATWLFIRFASRTPSKDMRTGAVRGFSKLQSI